MFLEMDYLEGSPKDWYPTVSRGSMLHSNWFVEVIILHVYNTELDWPLIPNIGNNSKLGRD